MDKTLVEDKDNMVGMVDTVDNMIVDYFCLEK